jgi:ABC-type lipoprotein export system ATPase subunit
MGDEPTGNLDSRTSREVIELFKQLNETRNLTVILVTHDLGVARNAKRNIVLRDGKIISDTTDHEQAAEAIRASSEL